MFFFSVFYEKIGGDYSFCVASDCICGSYASEFSVARGGQICSTPSRYEHK